MQAIVDRDTRRHIILPSTLSPQDAFGQASRWVPIHAEGMHCTSVLGIGIEMLTIICEVSCEVLGNRIAELVSHVCSALQGLLRKLGVEDMMPGVMGMGSSQVKVRVGGRLCAKLDCASTSGTCTVSCLAPKSKPSSPHT